MSEPRLTAAAIQILVAIGPAERHGYAIMSEVRLQSGGSVRLAPGTLYVTLKRLLDAGLIEEVGERSDDTIDDERRRYYRLTPQGVTVVSAEIKRLSALVDTARPWLPSGESGG
jgi:DNA-binding PadR family transcriptional regulator